jgi:antitoxin component YwqK of YwqJK toxin-antitoxin module
MVEYSEPDEVKDGALDGEVLSYDDTGRILQQASFKAGQLDGDVIVYDDAGRMTQKSYFKDGKLDGETLLYHDGQLITRSYYKDGKQDGQYIFYDENGHIKGVLYYKNAKLYGESVWYGTRGHIIRKSLYRENKLDGETIEYDGNGSMRERSSYKDNKLDGEVVRYHSNGKVQAKGHCSRASEARVDQGRDGIYTPHANLLHQETLPCSDPVKTCLIPRRGSSTFRTCPCPFSCPTRPTMPPGPARDAAIWPIVTNATSAPCTPGGICEPVVRLLSWFPPRRPLAPTAVNIAMSICPIWPGPAVITPVE